MGKKYFDTKKDTLESSILSVWQEAAKKNEDKLDPVNKNAVKKKFDDRKDKDIDNDGDVDSSDKFLHKRRKAVSKSIANEGLEDSPNPANSQHLCAKNVVHEEWGAGQPVRGMHDTPDADGNIAWYDVMFEHGIEKGVSINELKVTKSESHHHGEKKKDDEDKEMLKAKKVDEAQDGGDFKPHMMYDPKTGKGYKADTMDDHLRMKKMGYTHDAPKKEEVKEYYEIGTDEYRDHTLDVTPGQDDPEWVAARDFKVTSMKEALAKVWGLDEKALDKESKKDYDEEDEKLKPVKGSKTMTGGKVAKVEIQPKIDG